MCLAVPGKVIEIKNEMAVVDFGGIKRDVSVMLIEDIKSGDYVLVHAGFAIQKLDQKEAKKTLDIFEKIYEKSELL